LISKEFEEKFNKFCDLNHRKAIGKLKIDQEKLGKVLSID
jgi:hypothetical protein